MRLVEVKKAGTVLNVFVAKQLNVSCICQVLTREWMPDAAPQVPNEEQPLVVQHCTSAATL